MHRGMGKIDAGKEEYTYCDERWVMYGSAESQYCVPETNITLYVSYTGIKDFLNTPPPAKEKKSTQQIY